MCEVLLRIADKADMPANHPTKDLLTRAGDVIVVCEDGHPWSAIELSHPEWCVVCLPGLDAAVLSDLVAPAMVTNNAPTNLQVGPATQMLIKRAKKIDLSNVKIQAFLATKTDGKVTVPAKFITNFTAAKLVKTIPSQVVLG